MLSIVFALPSCTSALYLAVKILNLKNQEILIPNITFAASANAAFLWQVLK